MNDLTLEKDVHVFSPSLRGTCSLIHTTRDGQEIVQGGRHLMPAGFTAFAPSLLSGFVGNRP